MLVNVDRHPQVTGARSLHRIDARDHVLADDTGFTSLCWFLADGVVALGRFQPFIEVIEIPLNLSQCCLCHQVPSAGTVGITRLVNQVVQCRSPWKEALLFLLDHQAVLFSTRPLGGTDRRGIERGVSLLSRDVRQLSEFSRSESTYDRTSASHGPLEIPSKTA